MFHPIMFKEHRVGLKSLVQWVHLKLDNLKSVKEFFLNSSTAYLNCVTQNEFYYGHM